MIDIRFEEEFEDVVFEKNQKRAFRRKNDIKKALRKKKLFKETYGVDFYDNLHEFSKNKIHCSCRMCAVKTNYIPEIGTYHKYGKNWSVSDIKKIERCNSQFKEL